MNHIRPAPRVPKEDYTESTGVAVRCESDFFTLVRRTLIYTKNMTDGQIRERFAVPKHYPCVVTGAVQDCGGYGSGTTTFHFVYVGQDILRYRKPTKYE